MNDVFRLFIDYFVMVYLHNILNFSKSWEDQVKHVRKVLDVLKREKLCINMPKCEFGKTSLVYLGYIVGGGELKIDPYKVEPIMKWPLVM
jgi:hypothetical protein